MSLNKVQLIGNLTRDPEMKQLPGGATVTNFGIATNMTWNDQDGNKQEKVEFHNIVAWRKLGEICGEYLKKGSKIYIEGRLQTRDWEAEDGSKRYRTEIVADNMIMLDKKGENSGGSFGGGAERSAAGISKGGGFDEPRAEDMPEEKDAAPAGAKASSKKDEEVKVDDLPF
ncbi:single-stranded DNA-binding protein [Candidatus Peregrinibacteria bacterium]|nr:single-stranded DNA-binding protein [Candidatus Peregrinibacteria bacterium]MBT4055654.1 single-stranded DNA-binding protein [Candidatus Peregrinibacteria bacterium]